MILFFALLLFILSCSDDQAPTKNEPHIESMYSWLNINSNTKWNYNKETHIRGKEWVEEAPEYGKYLITSDTSSIFTLYKTSDNSSSFVMDLSYDSTEAYLNTFSTGDDFVDKILKKLDFKRIKIADMTQTEWVPDTLFYNNIALDDKNTFYGYIAFKANRLADSTIVYNGVEKTLKQFRLEIRIIANQIEKGYYFTIYPAYYFSLIDGVGFYRIKLYNHTNTAIAIEELDYKLQNTKQE